jgi:hypothetical protein
MSYATQRYLSIAVAMTLAGWALVQVADPADFGLTPVIVRWLGVVMAMLGVGQGFLPSVRGMSKDPGFLANRVSELEPHDRAHVVQEVQDRAGESSPPMLAPTADEIAAAYDRLRRDRIEKRLRDMGGGSRG